MMGEWREVHLEEVAADVTVGHVGTMASEYVPSGVPFLRSQNVEPLRINDTDLKFITTEFHARLKKSALSPGEVVIVRTGKPGACAVIPDSLPIANCSDLVIIRCGPKLDPRFLAYYVNSVAVHHVNSHLVGAVQQHFNVGSARKMLMRMPELPEQRAIAHILGTLDDKIELNRGMNETLEATARAIFKSWFVDFDPVRAKLNGQKPPAMDEKTAALFPDEFEESELGKIPRGWRVQSLQELTSAIGSGATPRGGSKVYIDEGIALVRSQNVYDCEFRWDGLAHITPDAAETLAGVTLEPEDILFNITGASILRTCILDPAVLPARVNQHVARIRARKPVSSRFLHLHLVRREMKESLIGLNAGATREAITKGHLQSIRLVAPPNEIYAPFDSVVGPVYAQVQNNLRQSASLSSLRDTLLPKLLSGELRVPDAEKIVEGVT